MKRRDFIGNLAYSAALISSTGIFSCSRAKDPLNILVLGGTYFVGPAIVNAALQNNHRVTLFNRGITNPDLFPTLRHIKGDRAKGIESYEPLKDEKWDVIIDVWPEKSNLVDDATRSLMNHTNHYIFISSIAVYSDFQTVGLHEKSEVVDLNISPSEWDYSEEKLAAEQMVKERFPENHTILRPGPIKGWRDPALDLIYWCLKLNRNDSIIAPGSGTDPLQFIDVNDVGRFSVMAAEDHLNGLYNCVGPTSKLLTWKEFLHISKNHFNSTTELIWADEDFLRENNVMSFSDLPLWAPLSEDKGFMQISNRKLVETNFLFTPIGKTLDDCMKWFSTNMDKNIKFGTSETNIGLERSKELSLIEMLSSKQHS